jgi:UMF1 family MFS transporter
MSQYLPRGNKKLLNAWAFYDWANSVYSLVIATAIFPIFYLGMAKEAYPNDQIPIWGMELRSESIIVLLTAFCFLVVSIISPILSGLADYGGNKKSFLMFFCYLGSFSCMGLWFFDFDYLWVGLTFYALALIGFWASLVFYNSYLPDLAYQEQQDKYSARGFSMGYIGSVILLIVCLFLIEGGFFESKLLPTRISFLLVGVWWLGFAHVTFYFLPPSKQQKDVPAGKKLTKGFGELRQVWEEMKNTLSMKRYLGAFFIYSMAVQTVMLIATYFGEKEVSWPEDGATQGLIISILLIQLVAIVGAGIAARLSRKHGNIRVLIGINIIWVGICTFGYFVHTPIQFYIAAGFVGLVMGAIQSLSRSTYSKLIPPSSTDTTSYFSFYDVSEKIGIVVGMLIFAIIDEIFGGMRYSILFLILFFVIGVVLLLRVPKDFSTEPE